MPRAARPRRRSGNALLVVFLLGVAGYVAAQILGRHGPAKVERPARERPEWHEARAAVLFDSAYLPALRASIASARRSIDVLQYEWSWHEGAGASPRLLLSDLQAAARRGVRVRVLLEDNIRVDDPLASNHRRILRELRAAGIDARLDDARQELHDKSVIVDRGETVFVGSHSWSVRALGPNHEASVIVVPDRPGEAAADLCARFDSAYADGRDLGIALGAPPPDEAVPPKAAGGYPPLAVPPLERARIRFVADGAYGPLAEKVLRSADTSIHVAMYYMRALATVRGNPVDDLLAALADARRRGAEVDVVLDDAVKGVEGLANEPAREELEAAGVRAVYDHPGAISHAKAVAVDGRWALVGSQNWSLAALRFNRESAVLLDAPWAARSIAAYLPSLQSTGGRNRRPLKDGERVNVNTADAGEIERLPGLGPGLARKIVEERDRRGPFRSAADLRRVPGIGRERLALIRAYVEF